MTQIEIFCYGKKTRLHGIQYRLFVLKVEISCISQYLVAELETRGVKLTFLLVPRIKFVGVTYRKGPMSNLQTAIDIEGIGKPKKAALLVVKLLAKPLIFWACFSNTAQNSIALWKLWEATNKFIDSLRVDYPIFNSIIYLLIMYLRV
ncbi:hypothetical protein PR048_013347 [Dryococelus australis]|uniref:Uncharacterized protein n=1 Tax=Dryococelus australis TaxID=614101 RepID=A0ABQ9HRW7_9NEOP|nr:hypothetical protein PR048_013347 [Dryococelus australis]